MQPETFFQVVFYALAVTVLAAIIAGCVLWLRWLGGRRSFNMVGESNGQLITTQPQPIPRWSVFDFLLMFGMMILVASLLYQLARGEAPPASELGTGASPVVPAPSVDVAETDSAEGEQAAPGVARSRQLQIQVVANLVALLATIGYLMSVHGATLGHLTLVPTLRDVRRGAIATLWILAPVLIINIAASAVVKYEHAVTDLMAAENQFSTFVFLFLSAAVLTPIVEEFQFRLLLQGGLQKVADLAGPSPQNAQLSEATWQPKSWWPVLVTSLVFALMHFGQGAAPIPLFFLSLGLGMLYQRTGRLFPSIVVHMLLNGFMLVMEYSRLNAGLELL